MLSTKKKEPERIRIDLYIHIDVGEKSYINERET